MVLPMSSYQITGGRRLSGISRTPGAKNALFPIMSASILFDAPVTIQNIPKIRDADVMKDIVRALGIIIEEIDETTIRIQPGRHATTIPQDLARRLRGSVVLLGPLLGRYGEIDLPTPGGDLIGPRPIDQHLKGLVLMGAEVHEQPNGYRITGQLHGADIYLEKATVTGTENLIMAALFATGTTTIRHAAAEPHVTALAQMLAEAGAHIDGIGTQTLIIHGRAGQLFDQPCTISLPPDELDAGTMAIAALLTDGEIEIDPYPSQALRPLTEKLIEIGGRVAVDHASQRAIISRLGKLAAFQILVGYAPGFPSDLQAPMAVLATQTEGVSLIHDWLYQGRFGYVEDLLRFGAHIDIYDPHRIQITGPTPLHGRQISSPDIRAGMAYILAALIATSESVIDRIEIVERGYAQIPERLTALGASVRRSKELA